MSWQEELRKLDEELAAGQISADDYRVRRDQVLSSAVSSGPEVRPGQPAPQDATQFMPVTPPHPAMPPPPNQQPFPPPPQQQPPQPQSQNHSNDADKTQIVPGDADRTQTVGPWHTARPGDVDRTQAVPGVPPQSVAGGMPRPAPGGFPPPPGYHPPEWQQGGEELSPPWAGSDFPPLAPSANPDWIRQGPELFETDGRSKTGRILLIVLIAVVVAGIGVGAYFFFTRDKGGTTADPTTTQPPTSTTSTPRPPDDLEIAKLPGNGGEKEDIKAFGDVEKTELLQEAEKQAYRVAGAGKARLVTSELPDGVNALVLTAEATSPSHAAAARDDLVRLQREYTMKDYAGTAPPGVTALQFEKSDQFPAAIRAHYIHKKTIVRVQVSGDDLAKISKVFDELIATQLRTLAADA